MKAVDNYDGYGKERQVLQIRWTCCIYAYMETNFVDLVKPVGEEDDHKQKQNKENNTEDGGGRRVSAKDVRNLGGSIS